jgi:hypothetical protein
MLRLFDRDAISDDSGQWELRVAARLISWHLVSQSRVFQDGQGCKSLAKWLR